MKKRLSLAVLLLNAGLFAAAQTTITQWNFNNSISTPSTGSGIITLINGVTATYAAGVPADTGTPNQALNTSDYPAQSTAPRSAGIRINVNTTGYNGIHLKFYIRHSGSAAKKVIIQYFDGATWMDVFVYTAPANTNFSAEQDMDLSAYAAVNNSTDAQIRLVTDFSNGINYEGATGIYGATGTIRYDLISITGNFIGCVGPATRQATGFRLLRTDAGSAQLSLNRGDGGGCLVLCSQTGVPSFLPSNGTAYTANNAFGAGTTLGNGFAVYNTRVNNPSTQYFNITNLTAGTKYYVAAYEYSNIGFCYLQPALVDSFYCNSTILYPGDVQFIGYDNAAGTNGRDAFVLTNLTILKPGTTFQIVNSRYEAGAATAVRTNRWYAGGNAIHENLQQITIRYTGLSLPAGSIISFDHLPQSAGNIKINGALTTDLIISDNLTIGNLLSGSGAESFFITQGKFTTYGSTAAQTQYAVLDGHVLHGISYTENWVSFNQYCDSGNIRQSRIPPDINCMNLYFSGTSNFGHYQTNALHGGSQGFVLAQINNASNWNIGTGTGGNDIPTAVLSTSFGIASSPPAGTWTGNNDRNWFDCRNWQNRFVPDSTTDAIVPTAGNPPVVNTAISPAAEYSRQAFTRALSILDGNVSTSNNVGDQLLIYDSLLINNGGSLIVSGGIDTIIVRGNLHCTNSSGLQIASSGWLRLQGNRLLKPIAISLAGTTPVGVYGLSLNNPPGIIDTSGGFESLQRLELLNGIFSCSSSNAYHYIGPSCIISSPVNQFGETNKGWEQSFIDGKVFVRTNSANAYTAPLGSLFRGNFAPMVFQPDNGNARTYTVTYTASSHPNTSPADIATSSLDHVSEQEYWSLTCTDPDAAAKITLYYTPYSRVGQGGNNAQALLDLRIVQYWDSSVTSPRKWRIFGTPGNFTAGPNINYGKISYDQYATDLRETEKNFTLATGSPFNALPVQWISWKASLQNDQVYLHWRLANEADMAYYHIEKSTDGNHYGTLQTVHAAGITNGARYACFDYQPAKGWNFYRLKITGANGDVFYAPVEKIWYKGTPAISVFPNPAERVLYVNLPAIATGLLTLYTLDGRKCLEQSTDGTSLLQLHLPQLKAGTYILEYTNKKITWNKKVILK